MALLKTVRSAPVSIRNSTFTHSPLAVSTLPTTSGRIRPSSQGAQIPFIRINSGYLFRIDVADQSAVIFRVRRFGLGDDLFRSVSDEEFFPSYANEFATMARVDLLKMGVQPGEIALVSLMLRPRLGKFMRVGNFSYRDWNTREC